MEERNYPRWPWVWKMSNDEHDTLRLGTNKPPCRKSLQTHSYIKENNLPKNSSTTSVYDRILLHSANKNTRKFRKAYLKYMSVTAHTLRSSITRRIFVCRSPDLELCHLGRISVKLCLEKTSDHNQHEYSVIINYNIFLNPLYISCPETFQLVFLLN